MTNANANVNTAELRAEIAAHYDGSHYETISALYNCLLSTETVFEKYVEL